MLKISLMLVLMAGACSSAADIGTADEDARITVDSSSRMDAEEAPTCIEKLPTCQAAPCSGPRGGYEYFDSIGGQTDDFDLNDRTVVLRREGGEVGFSIENSGTFRDESGSGTLGSQRLVDPNARGELRLVPFSRSRVIMGITLTGVWVDLDTGIVYLSEKAPCSAVNIVDFGAVLNSPVPLVAAYSTQLEVRSEITVTVVDEFEDRLVITVVGQAFGSGGAVSTQLRIFFDDRIEMHFREVLRSQGFTGVILEIASVSPSAELDFVPHN